MNKIGEFNLLHKQQQTFHETLGKGVGGLKHNTPNFNFNFKYASPGDFGIEIQLHNGTNSLTLPSSDMLALYEFLKLIYDEPKEDFKEPEKPVKTKSYKKLDSN